MTIAKIKLLTFSVFFDYLCYLFNFKIATILGYEDLAMKTSIELKYLPLFFGALGFLSASNTLNAAETTKVTLCDTLAASTIDPAKVTAGVAFEQINVSQAEPACKDALAVDPTNPRLQFQYGRIFDVKEDYASAVIWYAKAAEQNYAIAQYNLGSLYEFGLGIAQDYKKAFEWYQKAADQNIAYAQTALGILYFNAYGTSQNYQKSFEWYQKAANQNDAFAQTQLGYMYQNGYGVTQDLKKALEWYQKSADGGEALGNLNVGAFYHNGQVVAKNEAKALAQWRIASNLGLVEGGVELIFSWAEAKFPDWLPSVGYSLPNPLPAPYDIYLFRQYPSGSATIYVGYNFSDKHLYYFGPKSGNKLLDLGTLEPFLKQALEYEKTINPS